MPSPTEPPRWQCYAEMNFALGFSFEPALVASNSKGAVVILDWRIWGKHVPRIWIRSIGPREIRVKQK